MTNAYQKAQELGLTGDDAAQVAALKAIKRHRRNVYITGGPANTESVNLLHLLTTIDGLAQRGVGFRSLTGGIDTTTTTGRLILHIFAALAEFERELTAERTARGIRAQAARQQAARWTGCRASILWRERQPSGNRREGG
jgi:DNA invertase Pin-like site-specific DNA recombinase